jgi:hypothetical protein
MVVAPRDPRLLLCLALLLFGAPAPLPATPPVIVAAAEQKPGPNGITGRQAREGLAALRIHSVRFLRKDARDVWRGLAWQAGREVEVAMDAGGRVAMGPEVMALDGIVANKNIFLYAAAPSGRAASAGRGEHSNLSGVSNNPLTRQEIHQK